MEMLVERLIQFGYFAGQTVVVVIAFIVFVSFIFNLAQKNQNKNEIGIEDLNKKREELKSFVGSSRMNKKDRKAQKKADKKASKEKEKKELPSAYVFEFDGDMKASSVKGLREIVTAILTSAQKGDEVVACIESPGGVVHGYGLAAAQLLRFKEHGLKLTVCVDKVAASGGYMMACVADKILAAPFAIVGSVGVLAQVPNFHRLLKKHDIDYKEITAGDYKRTISLLGEITEKGEEKFTEQIGETHGLFKSFVAENRSSVEIDKIATGEYWFARQALDLKLVDEIRTSDEYVSSLLSTHKVQKLEFEEKKKLAEKLGIGASKVLADALSIVWERAESKKWL